MEITVTNLNAELSTDNISRIRQKTQRMFNRVCDSILRIKVTIDDVNGPKGGKDKHCRVVIYSNGISDVVISDNQTTVMSAVSIALSRARLSLLKKIKRKQKNFASFSEKGEVELSTLIELERHELVCK